MIVPVRNIIRPITFAVAACVTIAIGRAEKRPESLVDATTKLELVSDDFELADGPAWDGFGALYVPDVKAMQIKKYRPNQNIWQVVHKGTDRISASIFSHGKLFVANNSGAKL